MKAIASVTHIAVGAGNAQRAACTAKNAPSRPSTTPGTLKIGSPCCKGGRAPARCVREDAGNTRPPVLTTLTADTRADPKAQGPARTRVARRLLGGGTDAAPCAAPVPRFGTGGGGPGGAPRGPTEPLTGHMRQHSTQALLRYWNEVRAGRFAPHRLEIEPSRIAAILSETFLLECVDAATYRYRLAGTRLCAWFGAELRGHDFLEGWRAED